MTSARSLRRGGRGGTYRWLGAVALGLSTFLDVLLTWTLVMQVGLADAHAAPSIRAPLLGALVAALVAGWVGWLLQPALPPAPPAAAPADPLTLAPGERAAWLRTVTMPGAAVLALVGATVLVGVATVATWLTGPAPTALVLSVVLVALVLATASTVGFHVRVDQEGLHVVSLVGLPRWHVPLGQITSVGTVSIEPMGDFGGWGVRRRGGRVGVVLRAGEAIEVGRRDRRALVVTVDDARTAAALLETLRRGTAHR